ncbi:MAG: outer membrane lipoprotein-sorting protein [Bradymonadaceae bacterium]
MSAPKNSPKNSNVRRSRTNSTSNFSRPTRNDRRASVAFLVLALIGLSPASAAAGEESDSAGGAERTAASDESPESNGSAGGGSSDADGETTGEELVRRALDKHALEVDEGRSTLKLTVENRKGERVVREMTVNTKKVDGDARTLVELTAPPDVDGQSFLFVSDPDGKDDIWMYVPAFDVTRRIEGSKRQGSFLGSHFTYNDLESRSLREATYERKGTKSVGEYDVHVVVARPEAGADSEYSKVRLFVRTGDYVPIRTEFYGDDGELQKTLFVERLETTDGGRQYVQQMKMSSENGGYSRIEVKSLSLDQNLPDSAFTEDQLGE